MRQATEITHAELVKHAARWLRNTRRCGVVLCEVAIGGESPDAIGWRYGGRLSVLVECKASRADFLVDKSKVWRRPGCTNAMGDERYYLAPAGLIAPDELPSNWGLLEVSGGKIKRRHAAQRYQPSADRRAAEMALLWSQLRLYQIAKTGRELYPSKRALEIQGAFNEAFQGALRQ